MRKNATYKLPLLALFKVSGGSRSFDCTYILRTYSQNLQSCFYAKGQHSFVNAL